MTVARFDKDQTLSKRCSRAWRTASGMIVADTAGSRAPSGPGERQRARAGSPPAARPPTADTMSSSS